MPRDQDRTLDLSTTDTPRPFWRGVSAPVRWFLRLRARHAAYDHLVSLDDAMLRDLGITRAQISFAVKKGRPLCRDVD